MDFSRQQAKRLCDRAELALYNDAQPAKLNQLTMNELQLRVARSRSLRDKWRDVARSQTRASQSRKGHRQTADNSRSLEKSKLFEQVHDAFSQRLAKATSGQVNLLPGKKEKVIPGKDRKIVTRAVRSIVKSDIEKVRNELSVKSGKKAAPRAKAVSAKSAATPSAAKTRIPTTSTKTRATSSKKTGQKSVVKVTTGKKIATKKRTARTSSKDTPSLAPTIAASSFQPIEKSVKAKTSAHNLGPHAALSKKRAGHGAAKRLRAHTAAANRRSQARRDAKR